MFFTAAIFSSVVNSIYLQPLILYFIIFKSYYFDSSYISRDESPLSISVHIAVVMSCTIGVILLTTPLRPSEILNQFSWSYKKIKVDQTNVNPYNFMTNLMEWYYELTADKLATLHHQAIEKNDSFSEGWFSIGGFS